MCHSFCGENQILKADHVGLDPEHARLRGFASLHSHNRKLNTIVATLLVTACYCRYRPCFARSDTNSLEAVPYDCTGPSLQVKSPVSSRLIFNTALIFRTVEFVKIAPVLVLFQDSTK
jgi:hypothetical protein